MKIFAISGLGADQRVFKYLTLEHELIPIDWIKPKTKEPIIEYSKRLILNYGIDKEEEFGILGVSFGGLIAIEISKLTKPKFTVLVSSVGTSAELNLLIKLVGKSKLIEIIPEKFFKLPKPIAYFMFGAKNKELLSAILDDTDLNFTKWALSELLNWKNETTVKNLIHISGTNDKLLPPQENNIYLIKNGQHFMIVDRATEVSSVINDKIEKLRKH